MRLLRQTAEDALATLPGLMTVARQAANAARSGDHARRRAGTGEKFWQFRPYSTSDRPQDIDWRQSAKGDTVFVREKEKQNAQTYLSWMNPSSSMEFKSDDALPTKAARAKALTLASALMAHDAHELAGMIGDGHTPGRSEKAIEHIGISLLENRMPAFTTLGAVPLRTNSTLFLCSDFLDEKNTLAGIFQTLSSHTRLGFVVQVLDPAERVLPYEGRVMFRPAPQGGPKHVLVENVASVRDHYRARIEDHIAFIKHQCQACGWGYHLHETTAPAYAPLFAYLEYLESQR